MDGTKIASNWESRHLGSVFIHRRSVGWVVLLGHSEGIAERSEYFVPIQALPFPDARSLAASVRRLINETLAELEGALGIRDDEAWALIQRPKLDRRYTWGRTSGNWSGSGTPDRVRALSGITYMSVPSARGWLVLLRSHYGCPSGAFVIPTESVPLRGNRWNADFLLDPVRDFLGSLGGTREIAFSEAERVLGWEELAEASASAA